MTYLKRNFIRYRFIIKYSLENWKLIIHLLLRTRSFGVNNKWKEDTTSIFAWSLEKQIWSIITIKPLIQNYKMMLVRSALGFIPYKDFMMIISKRQYKKMYPGRDYDSEFNEVLGKKSDFGNEEY